MGLTRQERLDRVSRKAWAHKYAVELNNRVPTHANGATVSDSGELIVSIELAERIVRVLDGDKR